jgi:hypothetical protein
MNIDPVKDFRGQKTEAEFAFWNQFDEARTFDRPKYSELIQTAMVDQLALRFVPLGGGRNRAQIIRWETLLRLSIGSSGSMLGFIKVSGGIRSLASKLGADHVSLWRDLGRWNEKGLIRVWAKSKSSQRAIVGIQIPAITEWLIWIGSSSLVRYGGRYGTASPRQLRYAVHLALKGHQPFPPSLIESRGDAAALIDSLLSEGRR